MKKSGSGKRIFSFVVIVVCVLKLIALWITYVQTVINLSNPLIPQGLLEWKLHYSIALTTIYVPLIILNLYYLLKHRMFLAIALISVTGIVAIQIFWFQIEQYFMPR